MHAAKIGSMGSDDASTDGNGTKLDPDSGPRPFAWHGSGEVLVADDEPAVRTVTARALQRLGLTPTACENGESAVAAFTEDPARWRLVVLDLSMPGLDGVDALQAIRGTRPGMPVIISSGYSEAELASRILDRAGVAFLQKPFTVHTLSRAVLDALGPPNQAQP